MGDSRRALTVDSVLFTRVDGQARVLLVRRRHDPFAGRWALPGGFVDLDEDLPQAAARELLEETGIAALPGEATFQQLGAYGRPGRDPRQPTVTVVYVAVIGQFLHPSAGDDAAAAEHHPLDAVLDGSLDLAFDHREIVADAAARAGLP